MMDVVPAHWLDFCKVSPNVTITDYSRERLGERVAQLDATVRSSKATIAADNPIYETLL
jgi:hypothetical protein